MPALSDYPFEGHYFHLPGCRLHYLDEGDREKPPVVMLHGNPSWSYYYRRLVLALRGRCRCLVPDHIGMGRSEKPDDAHYEYTLARRVDDLSAWLDAVEPKRQINLVVHDWGGMIGFAWAVRNPERVSRLVVLNTAAFPLPAGKRLPWQLRACRLPVLGPLLVQRLNLFCRGAVANGMTRRRMPPDVRRGYLAPYNTWSNRRAVLRFVQDIPLAAGDPAFNIVAETAANLSRLAHLPMLICWGRRDFVFDDDFLSEWRRHFPAAQVHAFDDAGHYILEDAAEDVIPLIEGLRLEA